MGTPYSSNLTWATGQFRTLELGDQRLHTRVVRIVAAMLERPAQSLPQICGAGWAALKACYRLLKNPRVHEDRLMAAQFEATMRAVGDRKVVLIAQDTTSLNFTTHPRAAATMGPISTRGQRQRGFFLHSALAIGAEGGEPLGLVAARVWARPAIATVSKAKAKTRAKAKKAARRVRFVDKESHRWLATLEDVERRFRSTGTSPVMISDRESDMYEYINLAVAREYSVIVRAKNDRALAGGQSIRLVETLMATVPLGTHVIPVPRADGDPRRTASLTLRAATVTLAPPVRKQSYLPPRRISALLAVEENPPPGIEPIRWLLLTTVPIGGYDDAVRYLGWYAARWRIERLHFVLKSGCHVEKLQLSTVDRIRRAVALYLPVACRLLQMTYAARSRPDAPCTEFLDGNEWRALACFIKDTPQPPAKPPTLRTVVRWLAHLGGFLGRKGDGEPGVKVLWRGLRLLPNITRMWLTMRRRD